MKFLDSILGRTKPKRANLDALFAVPGAAITLEAAVALGAMPIYRFGTDEQRRRWLPDLCTGERLAAFGLTEPGGGSDIPGGMRTTAALVKGDGEAGAFPSPFTAAARDGIDLRDTP